MTYIDNKFRHCWWWTYISRAFGVTLALEWPSRRTVSRDNERADERMHNQYRHDHPKPPFCCVFSERFLDQKHGRHSVCAQGDLKYKAAGNQQLEERVSEPARAGISGIAMGLAFAALLPLASLVRFPGCPREGINAISTISRYPRYSSYRLK